MSNSATSSGKKSKGIPNKLVWLFLAVSFLGFLDASYLTISHFTGADLNCSITNGCAQVTSSEYSVVFGVPVSLMGVLYYLSVFILSFLYFDIRRKEIFEFIRPLTVAGFLSSAWFVYLQLFVIHAICQYCMASAITSTILFILGIVSLKYRKD
jgi:uncharacterized membrane protein